MSKEGRGKRKGWKIALIVVGSIIGGLAVIALVALGVTEIERREGRELPIAAVDFSKLADGVYQGTYKGGRWGWRENTVRVTVASGKVTGIDVVDAAFAPAPKVTNPLFERVIKAQSLQVDTISAATITSKAYLKAVEIALRSQAGN